MMEQRKINWMFKLVLMSIFLFITQMAVAVPYLYDETMSKRLMKKFKQMIVKKNLPPEISAMGFYDNFKFNSTTLGLFNRYTGNSVLASLGGNNFEFHGWYTGLSLSNIETFINSTSQFTTTQNQNTRTSIENVSLNFHAGHFFNRLYLDIYAGYGHSIFGVQSTVNTFTPTTSGVRGGSNFSGNNNYIGGRATYSMPHRDFNLLGSISYIYNSFFQPTYTILYADGGNTIIPSLTTRIGVLTESAQVSYQKINNISPYGTIGLIQIVDRSYSNPIINPTTSSAFPQLTLADSGFFVGAGVTYKYKHLRLTPYYQYAKRGSTYSDNLVSLKVDFLCN